MYEGALTTSLQFRKPKTAEPTPVTFPKTTLEDIVKSVPKAFKNKAEILAKMLMRELSWNDRNELIINGKPIPGSNILDLVNDVIRQRKSFHPEGREEFTEALRRLNIPQDLVGNRGLLDVLRGRPSRSKRQQSPPEQSPYTPPKPKISRNPWLKLERL